MRTGFRYCLPLLLAASAFGTHSVLAGGHCRDKCEPCCKPRKQHCFAPSEAPRAEVAFAIPGVVREGTAMRLSEAALQRGIRKAAAHEVKAEAEADLEADKSVEERLTKLEDDVREMKDLMKSMSKTVERLANALPAK